MRVVLLHREADRGLRMALALAVETSRHGSRDRASAVPVICGSARTAEPLFQYLLVKRRSGLVETGEEQVLLTLVGFDGEASQCQVTGFLLHRFSWPCGCYLPVSCGRVRCGAGSRTVWVSARGCGRPPSEWPASNGSPQESRELPRASSRYALDLHLGTREAGIFAPNMQPYTVRHRIPHATQSGSGKRNEPMVR